MPQLKLRTVAIPRMILGMLALASFFSSPALAESKVDPCSLVTPLQLSNLLKTQVGQGVRHSLDKGYCTWKILEKGSKQKINLWADTDLFTEYDRGKTGPAPVQMLSGFGDEAYWNSRFLFIALGKLYLKVEVLPPDAPAKFDQAKLIAQQALSRLKESSSR